MKVKVKSHTIQQSFEHNFTPVVRLATLLLLSLILVISGCQKPAENSVVYKSEGLEIVQISEHSFLHITYLETSGGGRFACNGLVYIHQGEAAVFDTPSEETVSTELIRWIEEEKGASIKALVVNHFHDDCLGGIHPFHERNIPSYSNELTIELAQLDSVETPKIGFSDKLQLQIGGQEVVNQFLGHAHSPDNIVSYIPSENLLFGGCMVKSLKAGKGNLDDADTQQWPLTIAKIKTLWPELNTIVPGHGETGGTELLNKTIELFSGTNN